MLTNFLPLFSQIDTEGGLFDEFRTLSNRNRTNQELYTRVEGTPYYSKDFVKSVIYLKNGNYGTSALRYDLFQDEMEFVQDDKTLWLIKKDVNYISYGDEIIKVNENFEVPGKLAYYFVSDSGKYKVYIKKKVEYHPAVAPKGYSDGSPERFEVGSDEFFLQIGDEPVQKIKNKKALEAIFVNDQKVLDYIKKEKIKLASNDLQKLVKFLNTL